MRDYFLENVRIAEQIKDAEVDKALALLCKLRLRRGRLFILGNGGSAANASHAVNDFRKIAGIEAYAPSDNVAELTAWANDVSWQQAYVNYLQTSNIGNNDMLLILSVGGGSHTISNNLTLAMEFAKARNIEIVSIVSRDGGVAREYSTVCILIPVVNEKRITPHAESWQSIIWHLLCLALQEES